MEQVMVTRELKFYTNICGENFKIYICLWPIMLWILWTRFWAGEHLLVIHNLKSAFPLLAPPLFFTLVSGSRGHFSYVLGRLFQRNNKIYYFKGQKKKMQTFPQRLLGYISLFSEVCDNYYLKFFFALGVGWYWQLLGRFTVHHPNLLPFLLLITEESPPFSV